MPHLHYHAGVMCPVEQCTMSAFVCNVLEGKTLKGIWSCAVIWLSVIMWHFEKSKQKIKLTVQSTETRIAPLSARTHTDTSLHGKTLHFTVWVRSLHLSIL